MLTIEDLIEKFNNWGKEFTHSATSLMSEEDEKMFINVSMMEMTSSKFDGREENLKSYMIAKKRAEFIKLDINQYALLLIAGICNNPGKIVMYVYYLKYWQLLNNNSPITVLLIGMRIFPIGFPSPEALDRLWDGQKIDGQNLLDHVHFN